LIYSQTDRILHSERDYIWSSKVDHIKPIVRYTTSGLSEVDQIWS